MPANASIAVTITILTTVSQVPSTLWACEVTPSLLCPSPAAPDLTIPQGARGQVSQARPSSPSPSWFAHRPALGDRGLRVRWSWSPKVSLLRPSRLGKPNSFPVSSLYCGEVYNTVKSTVLTMCACAGQRR